MSATVETTTTPQCMTALQKANATRLAAAAVKRHVKAGTMSLRVALWHRDAQCIAIGLLLEAQPRWGRHRVEALLKRVPVSAHRKVRDLTDRQRAVVLELVEESTRGALRPPRTDVELVQWKNRDHHVTMQHLVTAGAPRTLCGATVAHERVLLAPDVSRPECRACWQNARW